MLPFHASWSISPRRGRTLLLSPKRILRPTLEDQNKSMDLIDTSFEGDIEEEVEEEVETPAGTGGPSYKTLRPTSTSNCQEDVKVYIALPEVIVR